MADEYVGTPSPQIEMEAMRQKMADSEAEIVRPKTAKTTLKAQEIQKLNKAMVKIPMMPPPLEEATPGSYTDSPFSDVITLMEIPRKFSIPNIKLYDDTSDPQKHVTQYKQRMFTVPIPKEMREACMCKGFGSTLTGPALQWFVNIPNETIKSFVNLVNSFNQHFASSQKLEKQTSDLYGIVQKFDEQLGDYLHRYNKEKVSIKCDIATTIEAFQQGLVKYSELYKELTKYLCSAFEDVQANTLVQIRLEEDKNSRIDNSDYEKTNIKASKPGNSKPNPYFRPGRSDVNTVQTWRDLPPLLCDYNLTFNTVELVKRLDNMGSIVKWRTKSDKPDSKKESSKWCDFHADIGNTTENCITLRREIVHILKNDYLKDLLAGFEHSKIHTFKPEFGPPPPPHHNKVVNFINGGSDICGITYSAAKRIARENRMQPPPSLTQPLDPIILDQSDADDTTDPHHDELVIKLQVGTCLVKRVTIDGGSSVNLIMLDTLNEMGINADQLTNKSNVLVGFSGEIKHTLGEISLPTYVERVDREFIISKLYPQPTINASKYLPNVCQLKNPVMTIEDMLISKMETEDVILNDSYPDRKALIGNDVPDPIRNDLIDFLRQK